MDTDIETESHTDTNLKGLIIAPISLIHNKAEAEYSETEMSTNYDKYLGFSDDEEERPSKRIVWIL